MSVSKSQKARWAPMSLGPQEDPEESQSGWGRGQTRILRAGMGKQSRRTWPSSLWLGDVQAPTVGASIPTLSPDPSSAPSLLPHSQIKCFPASLCPVALEGRVGSWTVLPVPKEAGVSLLPMLQRGADHFGMWSWQPLAQGGEPSVLQASCPQGNRGEFIWAAQAGCARIHLLLSPCPEPY